MKSILSAVVGATLALSAIEAGAQATPGERQVSLTIESDTLAAALDKWAQQSGFQIFVQDWEATKNLPARSLKGTFTAQDALDQLLSGTSLTYMWISDKAVSIRKKTPQTVPTTLQRTSLEGQPSIAVAKFTGDDVGATSASHSSSESVGDSANSAESRSRPEELEEIVVTGSQIRGINNPVTFVHTFDRDEIRRRGVATTQQFIASLPQNFSGGQAGASEDGQLGSGTSSSLNLESASGVNLRGLGTSSTLVLINGHRVASSATGTFTDVSMIPLDAVERVEVVSEGSSAVYGADAVAGVVNFVLRQNYDGAETNVTYGSVTEGPLQHLIAGQTLGHAWDQANAVVSVQYQDRDALGATDRSFTSEAPAVTEVLPSYRQHSALVSARGNVIDSVQLFLDGQYAHKAVDRKFATTVGGQATSAEIDHINATTGADLVLPQDWRLQLSGTYGNESTDVSAFLAEPPPSFANGSLYQSNDYTLKEVGVKADGALFEWSGGSVRAAIGGSYRDEDFSTSIPSSFVQDQIGRDVSAAFVEIYAPLVAPEQDLPLVRSLSFSAALRHDDYSDLGSTTNPKFGLLWSPLDDLEVRVSYGKSFRAPNPAEELTALTDQIVFNFPFVTPDGGLAPIFVLSGSKPLKPERAKNLVANLRYRPQDNLEFQAGFYRIKFQDRIAIPPFDAELLLRPEVYGSLVSSLPDDASAQAFLDQVLSSGGTFIDLTGTGATDVRFIYDDRQQNTARVDQRGIDLGASLSFSRGADTFGIRANATIIDEIASAFSPNATSVNLVDTYANPLRFRARADLSWARSTWLINLAINHADAYQDTSTSPPAAVRDYTTLDASLRATPAWFNGLTLYLNALNILNERPPRVEGFGLSGVHYDVGNADPLGRFVSIGITKKW